MEETLFKVNPKWIENPFELNEYLDFLTEISTEGTTLHNIYAETNRLKGVRIAKNTFEKSEEYPLTDSIKEILLNKRNVTRILLITEPWSVETAQILPTLIKIQQVSNHRFQLKIFLKGQNEGLCKHVLSEEQSHTPALIFINRKSELLHIWHSRSEKAGEYYAALQAIPDKFEQFKKMMAWYEQDQTLSFQEDMEGIFRHIA